MAKIVKRYVKSRMVRINRSAISGKFVTGDEVKQNPETTVSQEVKKPAK